jgi:hypothetical protein
MKLFFFRSHNPTNKNKLKICDGSGNLSGTCEKTTGIGIYYDVEERRKCSEIINNCAADFSLLNLPKGKSLGRSKPATTVIPKHKHCNTLCGIFLLYPSLTELPSIEIK